MTHDQSNRGRQQAQELRADSTGTSMSMGVILAILVAVLMVGGWYFMFADDRAASTASGPAIERTSPAPTTGQGGGYGPASK